mmetsp:Transcript_73779/g.186565  ORF Transcript_73779/g.186565 Transcript_73779/m.186565 type:complete len:762 (-) Transcript_73779:348-2633(-)
MQHGAHDHDWPPPGWNACGKTGRGVSAARGANTTGGLCCPCPGGKTKLPLPTAGTLPAAGPALACGCCPGRRNAGFGFAIVCGGAIPAGLKPPGARGPGLTTPLPSAFPPIWLGANSFGCTNFGTTGVGAVPTVPASNKGLLWKLPLAGGEGLLWKPAPQPPPLPETLSNCSGSWLPTPPSFNAANSALIFANSASMSACCFVRSSICADPSGSMLELASCDPAWELAAWLSLLSQLPPEFQSSFFSQEFQSSWSHLPFSQLFQSLLLLQPPFQSSFFHPPSSFFQEASSSLSSPHSLPPGRPRFLPLQPPPPPVGMFVVSRSSKIESKSKCSLAGLPSSFFGVPSVGWSGIDGGGPSVTPFVIHDGMVVPRPRPAGPREDSSSFASAPASDGAASVLGPAVIHAGSVVPLPRPAGPRIGDNDFGFCFCFFFFSPFSSLAFFFFGAGTGLSSVPTFSPSSPSGFSPPSPSSPSPSPSSSTPSSPSGFSPPSPSGLSPSSPSMFSPSSPSNFSPSSPCGFSPSSPSIFSHSSPSTLSPSSPSSFSPSAGSPPAPSSACAPSSLHPSSFQPSSPSSISSSSSPSSLSLSSSSSSSSSPSPSSSSLPGGFQVTSMVLAPVLPSRQSPSCQEPLSSRLRPLPLCRPFLPPLSPSSSPPLPPRRRPRLPPPQPPPPPPPSSSSPPLPLRLLPLPLPRRPPLPHSSSPPSSSPPPSLLSRRLPLPPFRPRRSPASGGGTSSFISMPRGMRTSMSHPRCFTENQAKRC